MLTKFNNLAWYSYEQGTYKLIKSDQFSIAA